MTESKQCRKPRSYPDEFKKQLVDLYHSGKRKCDICREYDSANSLFDKWLKQSDNSVSFHEKENRTPEQEELIRLRKENLLMVLATSRTSLRSRIRLFPVAKSADLVKQAFQTASGDLRDIRIFHTDRGNEFKNQAIDETLKAFEIRRSLSRKGCPYDNAAAEAAFKIIKTEFVRNQRFCDLHQLQIQLSD